MKKKVFYPLTLLMVLLLTQCGPTTQDAFDYNNELIAEELLVIDKINELTDAFATYEPENIKPALEAAKTQIDKSIKALEELGGFDGDTEFVDACLDLFKLFKSQLNNEYARQLEIYELPIEEYTKVEEDEFNELNKKIDEKYYPTFEKFSAIQEKFAAKWGFELESSTY